MRWQPAHLSGVASEPVVTCGPLSADAVPPPLPITASNDTAMPAMMPIRRVVFFMFSPPFLLAFRREDLGHAPLDLSHPPGKNCSLDYQYFHIWTRSLARSAT